jgi:hypothetical protein
LAQVGIDTAPSNAVVRGFSKFDPYNHDCDCQGEQNGRRPSRAVRNNREKREKKKDNSPNQFETARNAKDVAEQKEVSDDESNN